MAASAASQAARRTSSVVVLAGVVSAFAAHAAATVTPGAPRGIIHPHKGSSGFVGTFPQLPQPPLQYLGGPVLRTNETFAIFWGPPGAFAPEYRALVLQYLQDVAADSGKTTNVYSVLNQYFDGTGPIAYQSSFAGAANDVTPYPSGCPLSAGTTACITDAQVADELDAFLYANQIARPANRAFLVFTPAGVRTCFDGSGSFCSGTAFCAYHTGFSGGHGDAIYATLPFAAFPGCDVPSHPNANAADAVLDSLSHEHREMIDDPLVATASYAWLDPRGFESSDKCVSYYGPTRSNGVGQYNQVINGHQYLLQTEWSNALAAAAQGFGCVLDGADHAPAAAFDVHVAQGAVAELDGSVSSDPDPGDSISSWFWDFGDGTQGLGATQHHRYAAAGSYHVQLFVTDSRGATALAERDVLVSSPPPAPPHAFQAVLDESLDDLRQSVSGTGNASGMGTITEHGFAAFDGRSFPFSIGVRTWSALATKGGDLLFVFVRETLVDEASPPQGTDYSVSGRFFIEGGTGPFVNASGSGTLAGTCTSSFTSDVARCSVRWSGTITGD